MKYYFYGNNTAFFNTGKPIDQISKIANFIPIL